MFNRKCFTYMKKEFVEDKLIEKEHDLYYKMKSESTTVPQMFHDYFQFKYDIYKWRLETQIKSQLFSQVTDEENIFEKLKYDLGTPIFLNTLTDKIYSKMIESASVLA